MRANRGYDGSLRLPLRRGWAAWLALGLALCSAPCLRADAYALVVGVDEYPGDWQRLNSCAEDARDVADLLTNVYHVAPERLRVLLNGEATKTAVEREFRALLIDRPTPRDQIAFYFSGHGALMPNLTDTNGPSTRKVLVPAGLPSRPVPPEALIGHDELLRWLEASPAGKKTVVLDCCHSGTQTKGVAGTRGEYRRKVIDLGYGPAERRLSDSTGAFTSRSKGPLSGTIVWLGACRSTQVAYTGDHNSLFTGELLRWIRRDPQAALTNSFPDIQKEVFRLSAACTPTPQEPQCEGELREKLVATQTFPSSGATPPPTDPAVLTPPPPPPVAADQAGFASLRRDFNLVLKTDKTHYQEGEELKLTVTSEHEAHLRVYLVGADLQVNLIFPNSFQRDDQVQGGHPVAIPSPGADFRFTMSAPYGQETLLAVAQTAPFSDQGDRTTLEKLQEMARSLQPAETRTRGIRIDAVTNRISSAEARYAVNKQ